MYKELIGLSELSQELLMINCVFMSVILISSTKKMFVRMCILWCVTVHKHGTVMVLVQQEEKKYLIKHTLSNQDITNR